MKPAHIPLELRTGRLLLRAPSVTDAEAFLAAQLASRAELRRWMTWAQEEPTLEGVRANIQGAQQRFGSGEELRYHIWDAAGERIVGSSGFHALDWSAQQGEIGYWVATPHTGQGYALEVARALTKFGLTDASSGGLGLRRIEIRCDPLNVRSRRIAERLGYRLEATLTGAASADGQGARDTLIFAQVR